MSTDTAKINEIDRKLDRLLTYIEGPDDDRERGLITRVDRIEQREKFRGKVLWTIGGGALAALGATVWGWITKGGPTQ